MFERFTDRARRVMVLAQEESRLANHGGIGPGHILLGLIHEGEGVAAKVLAGQGVSLDLAREHGEPFAPKGPSSKGHIPFTADAKKALERSLREGLQLGHNYIGTEHLLLGLMRDDEGVAVKIIQACGTEAQFIRNDVIEAIKGATLPSPQYLRSPDRDDPAYIDAALPGVAALLDHGWTLVSRVIGPVVCSDCRATHTCQRYVEVDTTPAA